MDTLSRKCMDNDTVGSFCGCIADEENVAQEARSFCDRVKIDKSVTDEDLSELKMALMDREEDACCEC